MQDLQRGEPLTSQLGCIDFHLFTKPGENNQCECLGGKVLRVKAFFFKGYTMQGIWSMGLWGGLCFVDGTAEPQDGCNSSPTIGSEMFKVFHKWTVLGRTQIMRQ